MSGYGLSEVERSGLRRLGTTAWLEVLATEYLATFVKAGGSAVKFIGGADETIEDALANVRDVACNAGYWWARLDPGELILTHGKATGLKKPDFHRVDRFFMGVTRDVDWKNLAANQARAALESAGISLGQRDLSDIQGIAEDNGRTLQDLKAEFQRRFATPPLRDRQMTIEFRSAVVALGRAQVMPEDAVPTTEEVLLAWLSGRTLPGGASALKKIGIYDRINLSNARHMLVSFCRWLPSAGYAGVVVALDLRPYLRKKMSRSEFVRQREERLREAIARNAPHEELARLFDPPVEQSEVFYADRPYMHMLALLRHFLDDVGEMERFLLLVFADDSFFTTSALRCYRDYPPLQERIQNEVRDSERANPAGVVVHLEACP